jgi:short-subunit dehydrogenase
MNNTILITGASTGIGKEFAFIAAKSQNNVVLVARSDDKLKEICKQITSKYKVEADYVISDLSEYGAANVLYKEVVNRGYQVNYLVNNAGFGDYGNFIERDLEKCQQMMQLNIMALTELTYLFVKDMVKANRGGVLNVASIAAMQPDPYMAVYGATKSFVANFTEALHYELKGTGVSATVLSPGATSTEFFDAAQMSDSQMANAKMMTAANVAQIGYNAMMKGKLHVVAGLKNKLLSFGSSVMPIGNLRLAMAAMILKKR